KGITQSELQSAKAYLKGQFPPTIETTDELASMIAQFEFYGLDESEVNAYDDRIDAVTLADARRVIDRYFPKENLIFVLVGKAAVIESVARKYAPTINRKTIDQPGF